MPTENELAVLRAARSAGITSRDELANLMAQLGHESGGFARLEESFYPKSRARADFSRRAARTATLPLCC